MRRAENLRVLDVATEIAEMTYAITKAFPRDERFGLISQMRRAAISIGSNISEGCGRSSVRQMHYFLQVAAGSATELEFQARVATRLGFGNEAALDRLQSLIQSERRMLGALATKIKVQTQSQR